MMADNESFANYLGVDYEKKGDLVRIICPFHNDSHPSFVLYPELERGGYCFSCGEAASWAWLASHIKGIPYPQALEELGQPLQPADKKYMVRPIPPVSFCETPRSAYIEAFEQKFTRCSDEYSPEMEQWLEKKGLLDVAHKLGWKWHVEGVFRHWKAGIVIPYHFEGKCVYGRFRGLQYSNGNFTGFEKPIGPFDVGIQPYYDTFRPNDTVFIVEGESDAASVYAHGMSAIGVPGACSKKAINSALAFVKDRPYIKRIVACGDKDGAGQRMNELIKTTHIEFEIKAEFMLYNVKSSADKADLNDDHKAGLFKPPVEWGAHYQDNFKRNFPDSDFGEYANKFDVWYDEQLSNGVDPFH